MRKLLVFVLTSSSLKEAVMQCAFSIVNQVMVLSLTAFQFIVYFLSPILCLCALSCVPASYWFLFKHFTCYVMLVVSVGVSKLEYCCLFVA